ncbi:MAG: acyltransferase [Betaproteobacteria bacterium HGW-Betaproteobacteria-7]|jgi:peptidoglycan/LPS O-acetylase OafA/YrhL|nr:MAG: acyltransferase [Betaproteobacteria bacterium HGW-Betaproteobacteria-7]
MLDIRSGREVLPGQVRVSESPKLLFRTDIEGLRALAILLVLAAHANLPGFNGGFVGVDLFFVISGYLISGLLLQEVRSTGAINFAEFYARRIRRLLPALLLVISVTAAVATVLLTPAEQLAQSTEAAAALAWVSNFYFAFNNLGYFAAEAESSLFLHTWSLGVEEQFYLLWPPLLLLACLVARYMKKSWLLIFGYLSIVCFVLSFAASLAVLSTQPSWSFYLMPLRGWQFALGAICYWVTATNEGQLGNSGRKLFLPDSDRVRDVLAWSGLFLILAAGMFLEGKAAPYPGMRALVPSVGVTLVLLFASGTARHGVGRLLALPPMQWIGRISYSLYLWHWPVLLLGGELIGRRGMLSAAMLLAVSLLLATLTFYLVEKPARYGWSWWKRPRVAIWSAFSATLTILAMSVWWTQGAHAWLEAPEQQRYREARFDLPIIYGMGCDDWYKSAEVKLCRFGPENAPRTVLLLGDSIGAQWFPALARIYGGGEWRLLVLTKSACPIVDEDIFYHRIGREYTECRIWRAEVIQEIHKIRPDIVFLGSAGSYGFSSAQWRLGTRRVLDAIAESAGKIFLIQPTPVLPFDAPACLGRQAWRDRFISMANACSVSISESGETANALVAAVDGLPNASVLNMNSVVCPDRSCVAEKANHIVYRDDRHLTAKFVASISSEFVTQVAAIESAGLR